MLFSCFDYIPLSLERTDIKALLQSKRINFFRLAQKHDYDYICFLSFINSRAAYIYILL